MPTSFHQYLVMKWQTALYELHVVVILVIAVVCFGLIYLAYDRFLKGAPRG
jgi:hypothetical protein